jgi:hypothetical protein
LGRKIAFAIALVVVISVAVVVAVALEISLQRSPTMPKVEPPAFDLSLSPSNGTVLQGNVLQSNVTVFNFTGLEVVSLRADSGSSEITCSFNQTSGNDTFVSLLTLNVPESTDSNNYLIIKATNGAVTHSSSYNVSVLNSQVTVSGQITTSDGTQIPGLQIYFYDEQTKQTYNADINLNSYSIALQNTHTYDVTMTYFQLNLGEIPRVYLGSYSVNAPAGSTELTHNFAFSS